MLDPRRVVIVLLAFAIGLAGLARARLGLAQGSPLSNQTQAEAERKSAGCLSCHTQTDARTMHAAPSVRLGCTDCHGGDVAVRKAGAEGSPDYQAARDRAHVRPRHPELWKTSANPERSYTALLDESVPFVRFVNPGDLRAAPLACGPCHREEVRRVSKSPMTHGAMLYGAALYNNGVLPGKDPTIGESYGPDGKPRMLRTVPDPIPEQTRTQGVLPALAPFPRWELGQPGNPFRVFERGGRRRLEVGPARSLRGAGPSRQGPVTARPRHAQPHRPDRARRPEDAPRRPAAVAARNQRPSRRLPLERLQRLPRRLRERPLGGELRFLRGRSGTAGSPRAPTRRSRSTNRATRCATSSRARSPRASA